ncbi:MAG: DUF2029 domain-containing protein [Chitinispirillales bacterium]|jgi:hypothetical protein|nr:DUF2029 domain-containing protein [Chitinispirillales bacterium]
MKKVKLTAKNENRKDGPRHAGPVSASHENGGVELERRALDDGFSKGALNIFVFVICGLFVAFAVGLMMNPLGTQRYMFFNGMKDFFADFLNVLHYIAERDPYFNTVNGYCEHAYFPLAYMIYYPFSQLDNFSMMSLYEAWGSRIGLFSCFLLTGFFVFLLFAALYQIVKKYYVSPYILISLVLSYIVIHTLERGNLVILSAACVGFFICNYDSENKRKRIWAAMVLALAVVLKSYPVLFGILYLEKKQYRELLFCAVITLLLTFVPYLFFKGGFANIPQHIGNLHQYTEAYSIRRFCPRLSFGHLTYFCCVLLKCPEKNILLLSSAAKIINMIMCVVSIGFSCLEKNKWLKISLLTMALLFLPTNSNYYCGLYMFPMIILFFSTMRERARPFNIFVFIIFIVFLNPLQIATIQWSRGTVGTVNYLIGNVALLSLYLVLLISSGRQIAMNYIASISSKRAFFNKGA